MPVRLGAPPAARCLLGSFHTSAVSRAEATHYETLKVPQNASGKDIKKSFYSLSKAHHPDHNPNDPDASARFVEISQAYAVIGSPEKRQRYDRDVLRTTHHGSHTNAAPRGSYHSSSPAGGRPASGLSRRRTHFQGPPPSFYRSGGWGTQGEKRQAAHDGANPGDFKGGDGPQGPAARPTTGGGMGYGQQPFGHANDVPHFDREGHFRTHLNQEKRRKSRNVQENIPSTPGPGTLGNFLFISSILAFGIVLPGLIFERATRKSDTDSDKSKREN